MLIIALISSPANCDDTKQNTSPPKAQMQAEGARLADLNLTRMRAAYQRQLDDLIGLFPESIKRTSPCYQTALSNYVEDQWNRIAKEIGCASSSSFCGKKPETVNETIPPSSIETKTDVEIANAWVIDGAYIKFISPTAKYLAPNDEIDSLKGRPLRPTVAENIAPEELYARVALLNRYIASCSSGNPIAWSVVGTPVPIAPNITVTALKLGNYSNLIKDVLGYDLPYEKKGYVGCLATLFSGIGDDNDDPCHGDKQCIETIPTDTKESLFQKLDELKAHKCAATYVYEMNHR